MSTDDDHTIEEPRLITGSSKSGGGNNNDLPLVYQNQQSDGPGQMMVGDILTTTNYGEWVLDMKDYLLAKNKYCFVDGTLVKPKDHVQREAWIRCDAMVKGWLKTTMEKEIRTSVRYAENSREIWKDLQNRFGQGNASRAYELRRLITLLQQEKHSASAFYTRLRSLWEESTSISPTPTCTCGLCTSGVSSRVREQQESARLFDFLMGLDEVFSQVRTQVLAMKATPTLAEVFNIALNEEQQCLISQSRKPIPEEAVFAARGESNQGRRGAGERERPRCSYCQRLGHLRETCYELIGYPPRDQQGERQQRRRPRISGDGASRDKESWAAQVEQAKERSPVSGFTLTQLEQLKEFFGHSVKSVGRSNRKFGRT